MSIRFTAVTVQNINSERVLEKSDHYKKQSRPLHAGLTEGQQNQGEAHVARIHKQFWQSKAAGAETKQEEINT